MTRPNRAARRREKPAAPAAPPRRPAQPAAGRRPLTERGRNTRARLLAAARAVFSRIGFSEVRVTDITAEAGVASGTFYTYFDAKEEIFREVAAQVLAEMAAAPKGRADDPEPGPLRQLEAATRRYFDFVRENAHIARSIEEVQVRERGVGQARRGALLAGVKRMERWIQKLQSEGVCDPTLDPWPTAVALHAMNVSVAYDHLVHRDAPEESEALLRAILRIWSATLGLER